MTRDMTTALVLLALALAGPAAAAAAPKTTPRIRLEAVPAPVAASAPRAPAAPKAPVPMEIRGAQPLSPPFSHPGLWVDDDGVDEEDLSAADRADRDDRRETFQWRLWRRGREDR